MHLCTFSSSLQFGTTTGSVMICYLCDQELAYIVSQIDQTLLCSISHTILIFHHRAPWSAANTAQTSFFTQAEHQPAHANSVEMTFIIRSDIWFIHNTMYMPVSDCQLTCKHPCLWGVTLHPALAFKVDTAHARTCSEDIVMVTYLRDPLALYNGPHFGPLWPYRPCQYHQLPAGLQIIGAESTVIDRDRALIP